MLCTHVYVLPSKCFLYDVFYLLFAHSTSFPYLLYISSNNPILFPLPKASVIPDILMDHWHTSNRTPYRTTRGATTGRVLTTSSGNAQSYAVTSNEGVENQNPFEQGVHSMKSESQKELHFPVPEIRLGSNDHYADGLLRLQARRRHRPERSSRQLRAAREKPYLQHPKYIQYRARPRCDTRPDGKPVWDDRIEEAFQNALVNIEPMGRRKKSQRGRPHGRNELISEWILRETGEYRTRKQVSSHIQVLNSLLKDIPEWRALTIATEGGDSDQPSHEYYSDSIEQMVRSQNLAGPNTEYCRGARDGSAGGFVDEHGVTRLSFEMWVSLPNQMHQALHIYSRMQNRNVTSAPMQLEDIKNWRSTLPSLRSIVDSWNPAESCDIIMLEASFRLMDEFPPRHSKLGISLELDFLHPSNNNGGSLAALQDWSCKTHVYQHGRLVKQVAHDSCHLAGPGKIRPFFESKWWASTFTQLTEKRKMAEESKSDGALELANEYSHNFFRGLTVMQEVFADTPETQDGTWPQQPPRRRRMAILLWKFSQALSQPPNDYVGTTTWRKVLPPLESAFNINEFTSTDLPTLTVDSFSGEAQSTGALDTSDSFLSAAEHQYGIYADDHLYQDNFVGLRAGSMTSFDDAVFDYHPSPMDLDTSMSIVFDMPSQDLDPLSDTAQVPTTSFFELSHQRQDVPDRRDRMHIVSQQDLYTNDGRPIHQPLVEFDVNTHAMLQANLGHDDDPYYTQHYQTQPGSEQSRAHAIPSQTKQESYTSTKFNDDDEELRASLLAASAISDFDTVHHQQPSSQQPTAVPNSAGSQQNPYISTSRSRPFFSPMRHPTRPPLQTHHSFAGTLSTANLDLTLHSQGHRQRAHTELPSKDFESMLANLQAYNAMQEMSFDLGFAHRNDENHDDSITSFGIGMGISRPQSQPVPMSGAVDVLYGEIIQPGQGQRHGQAHT